MTIVYFGRLLGIALILALSYAHAASAKQPCHEPAAFPLIVVVERADKGCDHTVASLCARRCGGVSVVSGTARLEITPAVATNARTFPQPTRTRDRSADRCRPAGTIPRLSKSLLFCSWLS